MAQRTLKRTFGLTALLIYGIGDILGAGIYALIGKVASQSGSFTWISFLIALLTALLTALSYAELTQRHPRSGGASYFIQVATKSRAASFIVGWLLVCVSIVSMATLSRAFLGYIEGFGFDLSDPLIILEFLLFLGFINFWGGRQSSTANIISTTIEVFGLFVVVAAGIYFISQASPRPPATHYVTTVHILEGAALAFYAFIGFEDLANVAEEVKNPRRNLPIAIVGSLVAAGILYIVIGWISTAVMKPEALARSSNPLTDIVAVSDLNFPVKLFGVIALFAVANTCLLNFITASRLLYGMSMQRILPSFFSKIHSKTRTPYVAIASILPVAFLLASFGDLTFLAGTTSGLILFVFCATNYSLIRIKNLELMEGGFQVPSITPWLALAANIGLLAFSQVNTLLTSFLFVVLGALIYWAVSYLDSASTKRFQTNES